MPNSLMTGVSGLVAHQRLLDVVGHNLANMNTTAYKSQRVLFADLLYETLQPATGPSDSGLGGTNPNQVGGGVRALATDRMFTQGAMEQTGNTFDMALEGQGFFTITNGQNDMYTRAGSFAADEEGYLVTTSGNYVKRFGTAGEATATTPGFQIPGDERIRIPLGESIEGAVTTEVSLTGNLSADASEAIAQSLQTLQSFQVGGAAAVGTDLLNNLDTVTTPYTVGDEIVIEGARHDGTPVNSSFTIAAGSTVQDLLNAIAAEFPDATASLVQGNFVLEANTPGESQLRVSLRNDNANVDPSAGIPLGTHQMAEQTAGVNAGVVTKTMTVYDVQGGGHEITIQLEKKTDDSWTLTAGMDPSEGTVTDNIIDNIAFSDDGQFLGSDSPATITLEIAGIAIPQTITFDFGDPTSSQRLTHFVADSSLSPLADGSRPGTITRVQVESTGEIKAFADNNKSFTVATLAIAGFTNPKGLAAEGGNAFVQTLNSGAANIGQAGSGGRGIVRSAQLEASNVDVANEFTKLIVAQTGYNANARTITVSSELLEELTNLAR